MKIIVCGAGIVGSAISEHLAHEGNDVTVIDSDAEKIQRITEHADVGAVMGVASHPDVLAQAGLAETDLIIAVTDSDEVNMVACQVAHTIFETPTKISRIRSNAYLSSQAQLLYASNNFAIDHIISPEREVSRAVGRQHALDMILRARKIDGREALAMGLVTEIVPIDQLKSRAQTLGEEIAKQPRQAVQAVLDTIVGFETKTLEQSLADELAAVHKTLGTPDANEGMLAFMEKRKPVFNQS